MASYAMEIFEAVPNQREPVLRERSIFAAPNDIAAIKEADRRFEDLAKKTKLSRLVLSEGNRAVYERRVSKP